MAEKCWKLIDSDGTRQAGAFGVIDYDYELKIQKLKMADPL